MTSLADRVRQFGLSQVYSSPDPQVDIVLVHGLNGHPYKTWATNSDTANGVYWPADLLPEVLDRVRILTYGYNANVSSFSGGVSNDRLLNHAETLASALIANRNLRKCPHRPIIFVCHSLGGLVVKRTLIYCNNITSERTEHLRSIYVSTYGILFLGTPHNGSDMAKWGLLLQNICTALMPKKLMESSSNLVKTLKTNNENLQNINSLFVEIMSRYHIYYFHETLATDVKGGRELIVDESSAAPQAEGVERTGIEADHRHMCKFEDEASPGYEAVAEALLRYSSEAPDLIARRWQAENEERRRKKMEKADELFGFSKSEPGEDLGGSTPNLPSGQHMQINPPPRESRTAPGSDTEGNYDSSSHLTPRLLIAPPGFHPNNTFYGMEKEIDTLHNRLFKSRKRPNNVRAVLISGVPGSGKTHLARQYVWTYRDCYPGGIFWIDSKSPESIFKCFWDIAQAAMLTADPDFQLPSSQRSQKFVEEVRKWFQTRDKWLLVFDGIAFSHEEDINDFRQFLPFKEKCSIIYTSVDSTLRRKQRLYEPYCLQIPPLQVQDACKLLFKDLGISRPNPQEIRKATALVKHYECLPLAIHAISHHLSVTQKPIEKYHINSHLTDKKVAEPFLRIMNDLYQMGHFEALNLINLLSFFGHHVPVGLIMFGRTSLEAWNVEILTRSGPGERGDIDTTLSILIRCGLIERSSDAYALQAAVLSPRSEKDNILDMKAVAPDLSESQTESSQEAFFSMYQHSGSIDFIKIHSVVQGFCRDELKIMDDEPHQKTFNSDPSNAGYYASWLAVATRVFCTSYENARKRMGQPDDFGLVKDYREYETHASRLAELFPKRANNEHEMVRQIREELKRVRRSIGNEIERISPSSSQESIRKHRSVFDRSSSSASSVPDSLENGPSRHTTWDPDDTEPEVESPQEMPKTPHNLCLKPFLPHIFRESSMEKNGYETDEESEKALHRTSPALSQMTETTERPISSQASTHSQSTDEQEWHVVPSKVKPRPSKPRQPRQRPRFPRGIRPKLAAPILKVETAQGRSASSGVTRSRRSSVSASEALIAVHNASPPQPHSRISKGAWSQPSVNKENIPTYATVAARSVGDTVSSLKPRSSSSPGGRARPTYLGLQAKASGESLLSHSTVVHGSPELRPDYLLQSTHSEPDQTLLTQESNDLDPRTSRYHTRHLSTMRQMATAPIMDMSASTPLLAPLPYDTNIEVSYARPRTTGTTRPTALSQTTTNMSVISHPSAIMPGVSPPPSVTAEPPPGYSSDPAPEPMTRGPSGQSHQSWSTEPVRYPPKISPIPPGTQSLLPAAASPIISQQQVLSGTGSWAGELQTHQPSQKVASALQADVTYASQAHLRPIGTLEEQMAVIDSRWDPDSVPTLHFGAHRVDVRDARQRLVEYRAYEMGLSPQMIAPYNMYHSNLSGPLIRHEPPLQHSQELRGLRPRSGSSPTHPGFSHVRL